MSTSRLDSLRSGSLTLDPADEAGRRIVRVAVIDSGVHEGHPHVGAVSAGISVDPHGRLGTDVVDRLGHGTAVAAAIREKGRTAEILPVKVFDRELRTTVEALEAAIHWAVSQQVDAINLSLGTANPQHEARLADVLASVSAADIVLLAAAEQDGVRWLPGSLTGAVGVTLDWTCPRHTAHVITDDSTGPRRVSMRASGYPRPIPGVPQERNLSGVSFSVANATGLLCWHWASGRIMADERTTT